MIFSRTVTIIFLFALLSTVHVSADEVNDYFPTGMIWKETYAEPGLPLDTIHNTQTYEIGKDTLIKGTTYKCVITEGESCQLWIRENKHEVWLLTSDYPKEIKLYDFNWEEADSIYTEYLQESGDSMKLYSQLILTADSKETHVGQNAYQYLHEMTGTTIRNIGRVTELNRNSCLLGYKVSDMILPGYIFRKVLWIRRNNTEVFRSVLSDEWSSTIPNGINIQRAQITHNNISFERKGNQLICTATGASYIELYKVSGEKIGTYAFRNDKCIMEDPQEPSICCYVITYPNGQHTSGKIIR